MAQGALTPRSGSHTYAELRRHVQETLLTGQRRIEEARVHTCWETGRLIDEHLLHHQDRAEYGSEVIRRLAHDLDIHGTVLYRCLRFARAFPIVAARQQLTWAHYLVLSSIADNELRKSLEQDAVRNGWTSRQLEEQIRPDPTPSASPPATAQELSPKHGMVGIYRLAANGNALTVDLGFTSYLKLETNSGEELFLNTLLLENGHAVRKESFSLNDWETLA